MKLIVGTLVLGVTVFSGATLAAQDVVPPMDPANTVAEYEFDWGLLGLLGLAGLGGLLGMPQTDRMCRDPGGTFRPTPST
jgi:hypothetical protein